MLNYQKSTVEAKLKCKSQSASVGVVRVNEMSTQLNWVLENDFNFSAYK